MFILKMIKYPLINTRNVNKVDKIIQYKNLNKKMNFLILLTALN
jgi:hypothetical protein